MSGSTEKPLADLTVVASTEGLYVLGFSAVGAPFAIEPAALGGDGTGGEALGLSGAAALPDASAGLPGTAALAARADHQHPYPTAVQVGAAPSAHGHTIADVATLQAVLDGKAAAVHTHAISGVNGLQSALDGKAPLAHTHPISDVVDLTNQLAAKQSISARGAANGYAPLDAAGKVPLANLPATSGTGGTGTQIDNGTADGQIAVWNAATSRIVWRDPEPIYRIRPRTIGRNSATTLSFAEYNQAIIVLSGVAPLSLAASEIGVAPDQGMSFMVSNRHSAVNTITFGAGITVDAWPVGTGAAGSVKVAANGSVSVVVYPGPDGLIATVTGRIA